MNIRTLFLIPLALWWTAPVHAQPRPARVADIHAPAGFARLECDSASFGAFVRALPLKAGTEIRSYRGERIENPMYSVLAVVDAPLLFNADLEQCADFCMRFYADWHRARGRMRDLALFDFSGTRVRYATSGLGERAFLRRCFAYSNSHSIKAGCTTVREDDLRPGDLIVQNERAGIGHVSMVMDACVSPKGERLYLIGFGFMPAQEFHVERAAAAQGRDGWFTLDGFKRYLAEKLNVGAPVLRRF